ncbi:uncharacterized protein LOC144700604 [Wolffia australiana]
MRKSSRSDSRGRKALADVTNSEKISRSSKREVENGTSANCRELFLLAREDLSKVLCEIGELLTHASEDELAKDESTQEIESIVKLLSDMHSSLKSCVPRLKNTLKNQQIFHKKPEPAKELIVSSSPLVSWRNGACNIESGRQLFLLTPLHKLPPTVPRFSGSSKIFPKWKKTHEVGISPLKTCSLLGSASLAVGRKHKSTPWAALKTRRMDDDDDDHHHHHRDDGDGDGDGDGVCSSLEGEKERSRALTVKYPELYGLELPPKPAARRKEMDESLDWFLSPPKTCIVWEPIDENKVAPQSSAKLEVRGSAWRGGGIEAETPAWEEMAGRSTAGRKKAGETTLKRELWTKFEAVSTRALQYDHRSSVFRQLPRNRFLDMLEEVS